MRIVTATEASRSFASLLDEAERGGTIVVTRGGRRVASIGPAAGANGRDVIALLSSTSIDPAFSTDVDAARESITSEVPAWPDD
jgi:prevent-host-death family protein